MMKEKIIDAVKACAATRDPLAFTIEPYVFKENQFKEQNHVLMMLKPELTNITNGVRLDLILDELFTRLSKTGIEVGAVRVLSSLYLKKEHLLEKQYGMLNAISRHGLAKVSEAAKTVIAKRYPEYEKQEHLIYGGHQFLAKHQELTPYGLELLTRNVKVDKLGAGTYAIHVDIDGEKILVLNPFHPCQVEWFTAPFQSIVVFECFSKVSVHDMRETFIGATDPKEARAGSFKHMLLNDQKRLGLSNICTRFNGIHLSPGPVEAMAGLIRYFSESGDSLTPHQTQFGHLLQMNGFSKEELDSLCDDALIGTDTLNETPVFELTESLNWDQAIQFLLKVQHAIPKRMSIL
ncbi:hypothetical protein [Bacillus sp. NPDC077027]|uniref:hypothetical protein n=1 Tax=Bacillus sp. NPDC077027 TaxID=3390548 RepID=UPI003CFCD59D